MKGRIFLELQLVILSGGSGYRLWPLSRQQHPKQFLSLVGEKSMLQATLERLVGLHSSAPIVVCNEQHRFLAAEQLRQINITDASILLEPVAKNTAPAITIAALHAMRQGQDPILLVLAADHVISDVESFHQAIGKAYKAAESGFLVTFGIVPTHAETGYGYIQTGNAVMPETFSVAAFVEKPNFATAEEYVSSGRYLWNSGMFMFRASCYLSELEKIRPDILMVCKEAIATGSKDIDFVRIDPEVFGRCADSSIDYAVMEKTKNAVVVPLDAGWSDVGSWSSLWNISNKSSYGNVFKGDVISERTQNTYVHASSRLVATLGVENLVVVETKDAVLVADRSSVQDVKIIVDELQKLGRSEQVSHREVYRPWGVFESIGAGPRYQVKRIIVNPGEKLSLQKHHHRAEHWVVVSGTAQVTNGDKTYLVTENQSTYIPVGQIHSLENPGVIPLELIEVQSGSYLGEDDIVRLRDVYGRA